MKKLFLMGFAAVLFAACSNSPETVEANESGEASQATEEAIVLNVNTGESVIEWVGEKHLGKQHHGTINITDGSLAIEDGVITAGNFTVDMSSIHDLSLPTEGEYNNEMLQGHLMSDDFFDVENHPTSSFEITSIAPIDTDENGNNYTVSGNMSIRGVSKEISFPAKIEVSENAANAVASFHINRMDWGVNYDQEGIQGFLDGVLKKGKDDFVKNEIGLTIKLAAN